MLEHVAALERLKGVARGEELRARLEAQGTVAKVQECRVPKIKNLIVDFSSGREARHILLSAHYDSVKNSPGANDNASGVAVLLGLCKRLQGSEMPVRIVFFDREEAWFRSPFLRLGLLGSFYYALRNDLSKIEAVYNLEFCGWGDSLAIWPVKPRRPTMRAVEAARKAAGSLEISSAVANVPGLLLSSDHMPFRLGGVSNSITLSLLPGDELPWLEEFMRTLSIPGLLTGRRPSMPGVLARIHKTNDDSSGLSEESLRLMVSLLQEILRTYPLHQTV